MVTEFPTTRITEVDIENLQTLHDQIEGRLNMKQRLADKILDLLADDPETENEGCVVVERQVYVIGRITEERLLIGSQVYYVRRRGPAADFASCLAKESEGV